jgi:hypothetical protein
MFNQKIQHLVAKTRNFRKWHHKLAIWLVCGLIIIAISGLLLGWKKQLELLPPTNKSKFTGTWIPVDSISGIAERYLADYAGIPSVKTDRMDIRPESGVAKITFTDSFWEVQIEGSTGKVLSVSKRYSDIIEKIHDGSIVDFYFGSDNQRVKLAFTTMMGSGLLLLSFTGLFLWLNPRKIRRLKKEGSNGSK